MRILPLIMVLACVAWQVNAKAQEESKPAARGLLKRGHLSKGKTTTTTTTPAPEEVEYEDDAEYPAEEEHQEPSTEAAPSSTEGKKLIGGVRPFRSNSDLLEALKRKRAQAAQAKLNSQHASAPVQEAAETAPVKANLNKKRVNSAANEDDAPPAAKPTRSRFGRPSSKATQEPEPEEQNDAAPPARTGKSFSRG